MSVRFEKTPVSNTTNSELRFYNRGHQVGVLNAGEAKSLEFTFDSIEHLLRFRQRTNGNFSIAPHNTAYFQLTPDGHAYELRYGSPVNSENIIFYEY